jgi:alpha-tubulin suppressor-like RCC1 family protein
MDKKSNRRHFIKQAFTVTSLWQLLGLSLWLPRKAQALIPFAFWKKQDPPLSGDELWSWGYSGYGVLGVNNDTVNRSSPVQIGSATDWYKVAAGHFHSVAIRTDGALWGWGLNSSGQINGTNFSKLVPTVIGTDKTWRQISAGLDFTHAIKADGSMWALGVNGSGQLGVNDTNNRSSPTQVSGTGAWRTISCGESHAVAIKTDGTLWAWGANTGSQLGIGTSTGTKLSPVQVGSGTDWSDVSAGSSHTLALKTDGSLWVWGTNSSGQLGLGDTTARNTPTSLGTSWVKIGSTISSSAAIKSNGTLWTWGGNANQELASGSSGVPPARSSPVQVGTLTTWTDLFPGGLHFYALKSDDSLWGWGNNGDGEMADGTITHRFNPVVVCGSGKTWTTIAAGKFHGLGVPKP